ncbi:heterokaryon incompatibility protein-domain-containing protein [Annulohypoxylon nitens]|nr:heterokaryon incompatibility protein-domain-containing protein [Annulohypoxylon nitens]
MRLLNAKKLVIDEFQQNIPPYAILSHTWGDEEVSFVDFTEGKASHRKGYQKISRCCEQTIYDGLEYVWIDTCCIDKRSSVELSEAINSMFNWYRDSTVCYAYLEDVPSKETKEEIKDHSFPSNFRRSRWFTRGWTLQELLAPSVLIFYTSDWTSIGTRAELKTPIAEITHISLEFFRYGQLNDFSIAQRMSWAAHRQTTRIEDQAYCLLGIFGVTMPLVYGEGKRAFVRLQEEIIKESYDQSIFAWHPENFQQGVTEFLELTDGGLLSPSPLYFANSGSIVRCENSIYEHIPPYTITNKGIQITLPVIENWVGSGLLFRNLQEKRRDVSPIAESMPPDVIAVLNCQSTDSQSEVVIFLKKKWNKQKCIRRIHFPELVSLPRNEIERTAVKKQIFVQAHNASNNTPLWLSIKHERLVIIEFLNSPLSEFRLKGTRPEVRWQSQGTGSSFLHVPGLIPEVILLFKNPEGNAFFLIVDSGLDRVDGVSLVPNVELPSDIDLSKWHQHDQCVPGYQKSPEGPFSLAITTREAVHGSIIRLKCQDALEDFRPAPGEDCRHLDIFKGQATFYHQHLIPQDGPLTEG